MSAAECTLAGWRKFLDTSAEQSSALKDFFPMREQWRFAKGRTTGVPIKSDTRNRVDFNDAAFKAWFDGSTMLDRDGAPRSFWHATFQDFDTFDDSSDVRPAWRAGTVGMYFTAFRDYACRHGFNLMQVCLKIRRPKIVADYSRVCRITRWECDKMLREGFDAVAFSLRGRPDEIDEICVFDPGQIRLVRRTHIGDLKVADHE